MIYFFARSHGPFIPIMVLLPSSSPVRSGLSIGVQASHTLSPTFSTSHLLAIFFFFSEAHLFPLLASTSPFLCLQWCAYLPAPPNPAQPVTPGARYPHLALGAAPVLKAAHHTQPRSTDASAYLHLLAEASGPHATPPPASRTRGRKCVSPSPGELFP